MCFKPPVKWIECRPLIPNRNDPITRGVYVVTAAMFSNYIFKIIRLCSASVSPKLFDYNMFSCGPELTQEIG